MDTGYILLACGLVGLAIAYNLWGPRRTKAQRLRLSWSGRAWLTRELSRGDLHALADLARGRYGNIDMGQIARLTKRGFVARWFFGRKRVTLMGWIALLLRATVAKDGASAEVAR